MRQKRTRIRHPALDPPCLPAIPTPLPQRSPAVSQLGWFPESTATSPRALGLISSFFIESSTNYFRRNLRHHTTSDDRRKTPASTMSRHPGFTPRSIPPHGRCRAKATSLAPTSPAPSLPPSPKNFRSITLRQKKRQAGVNRALDRVNGINGRSLRGKRSATMALYSHDETGQDAASTLFELKSQNLRTAKMAATSARSFLRSPLGGPDGSNPSIIYRTNPPRRPPPSIAAPSPFPHLASSPNHQ